MSGYCCNCKYRVFVFLGSDNLYHCGDCGSDVENDEE